MNSDRIPLSDEDVELVERDEDFDPYADDVVDELDFDEEYEREYERECELDAYLADVYAPIDFLDDEEDD